MGVKKKKQPENWEKTATMVDTILVFPNIWLSISSYCTFYIFLMACFNQHYCHFRPPKFQQHPWPLVVPPPQAWQSNLSPDIIIESRGSELPRLRTTDLWYPHERLFTSYSLTAHDTCSCLFLGQTGNSRTEMTFVRKTTLNFLTIYLGHGRIAISDQKCELQTRPQIVQHQ